MSSLKSRRAPTFAEHADALRSALIEVAENSFFAFVVPIEAEQFAELVRNPPVFDPESPPAPSPWLVTTVRFDGAFAGHVEIAATEALTTQLLSAFCGLGPDDPVADTQVSDLAGEFCNQVCGTWLTRACQHRTFDLQPPAVARRPGGWLPVDPLAGGDHHGEVLLCLNDLPLRLRVQFLPESL